MVQEGVIIMKSKIKCDICECPIPIEPITGWDEGNNAEPVWHEGRCCNECNGAVVIPMRMAIHQAIVDARQNVQGK